MAGHSNGDLPDAGASLCKQEMEVTPLLLWYDLAFGRSSGSGLRERTGIDQE